VTNEQAAMAHALLARMSMECVRPERGSHEIVQKLYRQISGMVFEKDNLYFQTYARFYLSWMMMIRGDIDTSLQTGLGTIAMGRRENYPGAIGFGSTCAAYITCANEAFDQSIAYAEEGVRNAGGIVDKLINEGMKGLALTLGGRPAEGLDLLQSVHRTLTEMKYFTLYNIVNMPIGLALASVGELAKGIGWLEGVTAGHLKNRNSHGAAVTLFVTGEIYRQMATGAEKPTAEVLRRNAWFLLRRLPFAKAHALRHYDEAIRICRGAEIHGVAAQAMLGKARIHRLARKPDVARAMLAEAQAEVAKVRWDWLSGQIAAEETALTR
jgi:hypothetical protein